MQSNSSVAGLPDHRVVVLSIPKSGTYLLAELLKHLGYRPTGMHLAESAYTDYREADLVEARQNPGRFERSAPLEQSLPRVGPGEFAVGHLPSRPEIAEATSSFKRLYLTRDLRTALISYMRFLHATGRLGAAQLSWYAIPDLRQRIIVFLETTAPHLLEWFYAGMAGWTQVDGVLPVRFEALTGEWDKAIATVNSIAAFLGIANCDPARVLLSSLAAETLTRSDGRTKLDDYWSDEAENQFVKIGGVELNARLGC